MWRLLSRLFGQREPEPHFEFGTRPGFVWWPEGDRWVPEAETYQQNGRSYALIGPVYQIVDRPL